MTLRLLGTSGAVVDLPIRMVRLRTVKRCLQGIQQVWTLTLKTEIPSSFLHRGGSGLETGNQGDLLKPIHDLADLGEVSIPL